MPGHNLPYEVWKDKSDAHLFHVEGPKVEKMLGYTNLESEKGFRFFQNFLKDTGILRDLEKLGEQIGSDVAFCIAGGTSLARGRGEVLEDLTPMPDCAIVVCKPGFSISTPELFRKLDQIGLRTHPDTTGMLSALESGNLKEISMRMFNVFEEVEDRRMRSETEIKHVLLDYGALGAVMTGTGSAVFGVFSDETAAETCAAHLRSEHKFCRVARPTGRLEL